MASITLRLRTHNFGFFQGLEAMSDDEREEKELDLTSPEVVTKYKSAAEIANSYFLSPSMYLCLVLVVCICMLWFSLSYVGLCLIWVYYLLFI